MAINNPIPFVSSLNHEDECIWLERLSALMPDERILPLSNLSLQECQSADIAIVANPNPDDLRQLPNLSWVHSVWAGVERLLQAWPNPPFRIVRLIDPELSRTMAEAVLSWVLFLHRNMPEYTRQQAQALWQPLPYRPARECSVGILGLGQLGTESAELLAKVGFNIKGWSRRSKNLPNVTCFSGKDGLIELLKSVDILVCLLPYTPETEALLDANTLSYLQPGAKLINFARGKILDDVALLDALNAGRLQHAVLDVFAVEPLPRSHIFWKHPNITVLPHISAPTTIMSASLVVAENIRNYRTLNVLPDIVDIKLGY